MSINLFFSQIFLSERTITHYLNFEIVFPQKINYNHIEAAATHSAGVFMLIEIRKGNAEINNA